MSMFVVLKGTQWHSMDPEAFRLSTDAPDCCETICDAVEINDPFVTLTTAGTNAIFVQAAEVVLMREYGIELPPGADPAAPPAPS